MLYALTIAITVLHLNTNNAFLFPFFCVFFVSFSFFFLSLFSPFLLARAGTFVSRGKEARVDASAADAR
jgi:hypothetical protein